jgi:pimeloyl-ACP methyl ester carboxylesterase
MISDVVLERALRAVARGRAFGQSFYGQCIGTDVVLRSGHHQLLRPADGAVPTSEAVVTRRGGSVAFVETRLSESSRSSCLTAEQGVVVCEEEIVTVESNGVEDHLREVADLAGMTIPEFVTAKDAWLDARKPRLHYLDWGTHGRPPVLFLHGRSLTAHTWDLVCLALRKEYHCRALDLRGHGDSDWSEDGEYSLDAHCSDVESAVEQLGLDRFILVGMSLGGATSLTYAGRHADKLAALVLVDIGPDTHRVGGQQIANFAAATRELPTVEHFVQRAMAFNPLRRPEMLRRSLLHNLKQTPHGTWTWKYDPRPGHSQTEEARAARREALWAAVPKVSCPTLVVRGGKSAVLHDEDAEALAKALPRGSWVRIEGAGHTVQGDQPKALVEALIPFFAQAEIARG